jgi:hypothetical protein
MPGQSDSVREATMGRYDAGPRRRSSAVIVSSLGTPQPYSVPAGAVDTTVESEIREGQPAHAWTICEHTSRRSVHTRLRWVKRKRSPRATAAPVLVPSKRLTRVDRVACLRGKQERRGARSLDTAQRVEPICPCRRLSLRSVVIDGEDRAQLTGRLWWCG